MVGPGRCTRATAFLARRGTILDPLVPGSDVVGTDLAEVAALILEADADR